jgi:hypothetical protein
LLRVDVNDSASAASLIARAVAWGVVRSLVGLLAAALLVFYAATHG